MLVNKKSHPGGIQVESRRWKIGPNMSKLVMFGVGDMSSFLQFFFIDLLSLLKTGSKGVLQAIFTHTHTLWSLSQLLVDLVVICGDSILYIYIFTTSSKWSLIKWLSEWSITMTDPDFMDWSWWNLPGSKLPGLVNVYKKRTGKIQHAIYLLGKSINSTGFRLGHFQVFQVRKLWTFTRG
jgi:hypothetical protein